MIEVPSLYVAEQKTAQYQRVRTLLTKYTRDWEKAKTIDPEGLRRLYITRVDSKGNTFRLRLNDRFIEVLDRCKQSLAEEAQEYFIMAGQEDYPEQ